MGRKSLEHFPGSPGETHNELESRFMVGGLSGHLKSRRNFGWVPPGRVVFRGRHFMPVFTGPSLNNLVQPAHMFAAYCSASVRWESGITKSPDRVTMWR